MKVPLLDLTEQFRGIKTPVLEAIQALCEKQQFVLGEPITQFEKEIEQYTGSLHAIGCASGSDAISLALMAMDLKPGEEVITTPYTFFASTGSIVRLGGIPRFVDIDPETYNMDPREIEAVIGPQTRAIMPVHLYGQSSDMDRILHISGKHGLLVIEDACQSLGASYKGRNTGCMGDFGCFSFFPSKNLGGFGDGGMVLTSKDSWAEKLRSLRVHGVDREPYIYKWVGMNSRLDALQAVVLSEKLKHLDSWNQARQAHASFYNRAFERTPVRPVSSSPGCKSIYHQYVIRCPQRDALRQHLRAQGIGTGVYYPHPLHLQPCFSSLGYKRGDFPVAEKASQESLALPVFPELTQEQKEHVVEAVTTFYQMGF